MFIQKFFFLEGAFCHASNLCLWIGKFNFAAKLAKFDFAAGGKMLTWNQKPKMKSLLAAAGSRNPACCSLQISNNFQKVKFTKYSRT